MNDQPSSPPVEQSILVSDGDHYDKLRKLASVFLARESSTDVHSPTSLLHQAWLRCQGVADGHGEVTTSEIAILMQHILVEKARLRHRRSLILQKYAQDIALSSSDIDETELLDLDSALMRLAENHPEKAELVRLRFFGGMTLADCAVAMNISDRTADRYWQFARAWLIREMER